MGPIFLGKAVSCFNLRRTGLRVLATAVRVREIPGSESLMGDLEIVTVDIQYKLYIIKYPFSLIDCVYFVM